MDLSSMNEMSDGIISKVVDRITEERKKLSESHGRQIADNILLHAFQRILGLHVVHMVEIMRNLQSERGSAEWNKALQGIFDEYNVDVVAVIKKIFVKYGKGTSIIEIDPRKAEDTQKAVEAQKAAQETKVDWGNPEKAPVLSELLEKAKKTHNLAVEACLKTAAEAHGVCEKEDLNIGGFMLAFLSNMTSSVIGSIHDSMGKDVASDFLGLLSEAISRTSMQHGIELSIRVLKKDV